MGDSDRPIAFWCSGVFRQYRSKHPFILGQKFDQLVEDTKALSKCPKKGACGSSIRPVDELASPGVGASDILARHSCLFVQSLVFNPICGAHT
jgi:hypothetical protein